MISEILRCGETSAEVGATGAELLSLTIAGRELIWPGNPKLWPRQAPVLFPFCGWLNGAQFRSGGREFKSGVHGFGLDAQYRMDRIANNHLRLTLRDDAGTRALFPFSFLVEIEVILAAASLQYAFRVSNPGGETLPYSIGFHPGFRWPFDGGAREAYRIVFEGEETAHAHVTNGAGLFTGETFPPPIKGRELDVLAALKRADATVLLNASTRALSFIAPSGRAIRVEMENFPHWVFWSLPPAPYLCIEGWTGHGDPVGFEGDILQKPGMTLLPPGAERRHGYTIAFG